MTKLEHRKYRACTISTYDFSTFYTTLPQNLIKVKLTQLIEKIFTRENILFLACNADRAIFTNDTFKHYIMWTCPDVCKSLSLLLYNIYVRYGDTVYCHVIGIPMGTNCAPLVADLFLYCYARDVILSLKSDTQADIIEAFNNTYRYLDDIFNIDNPFLTLCFLSYTQKSYVLIKQTNPISRRHV